MGCGYLGRRVAVRWLAQGHRVFASTRSPARAEELRAQGVIPVICDVLEPASLKRLPAAGTILWCVGFDRHRVPAPSSGQHDAGRSMREVYVNGLAHFLAAEPGIFSCAAPILRAARAGRLIYVSSTSVYGQEHGEEVDEEAATEPVEESGQVVLAAEQELRHRPEIVILRFAGIYGPGRLLRRQAIEAGEPLVGDAEKWLNLIHVEDGAAAILAAEASAQPGRVYDICDDRPVRRREFYAALACLLRAPEPRFVAPAPGTPPPPHERANRRIRNQRMHLELGVTLQYPSFVEGLPASLRKDEGTR